MSHDDRALAEAYHRASELQFERGRRLIERLDLKTGSRVLDVGCGTGRLARWMAKRFCVVGIDPSEERIAIARADSRRAGMATESGQNDDPPRRTAMVTESLESDDIRSPRSGSALRAGVDSRCFEVGRAEDLRSFSDASFDAVCMSSVLHWVDDKRRALTEAHRVLRPGGVLGVTTLPHELSRFGTIRRALDTLPHAAAGSRPGTTTTELISLVLDGGLELIELHLARDQQRFESGEALVRFAEASAFGTFLRSVPEAQRPGVREELVALLEAQRDDAGVVLMNWGVTLVARK